MSIEDPFWSFNMDSAIWIQQYGFSNMDSAIHPNFNTKKRLKEKDKKDKKLEKKVSIENTKTKMLLPSDVWSIVTTMQPHTCLSPTCKELHALLILLTCRGCHRISDVALCSHCGCNRQSKLQRIIQNAAYSFNSAGIDRHCHKDLLQAMKKRKIDAIHVGDVEKRMKRTSKAVKMLKSFKKKKNNDEFSTF